MVREFAFDESWSLETWQQKLRRLEATIGKVVDLNAAEESNDAAGADSLDKVSVVSILRPVTGKPNTLVLVKEGDPAPDGAALEIAGTVWIDGTEKTVVKVYRLP